MSILDMWGGLGWLDGMTGVAKVVRRVYWVTQAWLVSLWDRAFLHKGTLSRLDPWINTPAITPCSQYTAFDVLPIIDQQAVYSPLKRITSYLGFDHASSKHKLKNLKFYVVGS